METALQKIKAFEGIKFAIHKYVLANILEPEVREVILPPMKIVKIDSDGDDVCVWGIVNPTVTVKLIPLKTRIVYTGEYFEFEESTLFFEGTYRSSPQAEFPLGLVGHLFTNLRLEEVCNQRFTQYLERILSTKGVTD